MRFREQADLFRYLVLMKEGGIYADVDIMLDASLDEFVTPSLSFFAPRDVVCEYADESFCLWNGIIGSAPGHPFMIRAVERVVNIILERADVYDMERDVCRRVGRTMENWKVRAEPLLLASGPCALGVAVNDVLGRSSLARFDIGWIPSDAIHYGHGDIGDHGDALILVVSGFIVPFPFCCQSVALTLVILFFQCVNRVTSSISGPSVYQILNAVSFSHRLTCLALPKRLANLAIRPEPRFDEENSVRNHGRTTA